MKHASGSQCDQLHIKHEHRVRRDKASAHIAVAVGKIRRYQQNALAADVHAQQTLVPTLDHLQ